MGSTWDLPAGTGARWAEDYDRGRPGWPEEVATIPGLRPTADVVDLAAGTGKLTQVLAKRFTSLIAVEPQAALRAILETRLPGVDVRQGTGEHVPLPDNAADAVFVAQAFHWFANREALAEIVRILRPRGRLVLMWNLPSGPWRPSPAEAERVLLARAPAAEGDLDPLDFSETHATRWRIVAESPAFGAIHQAQIPNRQILNTDGLIAYYASMGWVAELPDVERVPLLRRARELLDTDVYSRDWETLVVWAQLDPGIRHG